MIIYTMNINNHYFEIATDSMNTIKTLWSLMNYGTYELDKPATYKSVCGQYVLKTIPLRNGRYGMVNGCIVYYLNKNKPPVEYDGNYIIFNQEIIHSTL